ncbi:MAG: ABC transporter ATP-binding protein [Bacteroidetes bacterium]|nr:MAG: ABC transporter ATP-binding protein [Bacteroidota bacterium]
MNYLQVDDITKSFGDLELFSNITFSIDKGQKTALIAKNGTGKTTLLNIIAQKDTADTGKITFRNDIKISYLEQLPDINENSTVIDEVFSSSGDVEKLISQYEKAIKEDDKKQLQRVIDKIDAEDAWDYETKVKQILTKLKINDYEQPIKELSGGQKKRVALANALINQPDFLILDEPTNHLDLDMIEWLEEYLKSSKTTLLMVTHDRYFLDRVCNDIIEIDDKQIYRYKGNYSYYLTKREERIAIQNAQAEKAKNLLKKEADWMSRMPQARATKAKYRIDAFYQLKEKATQTKTDDRLNFNIKSSRLGKKIIEAKHINKKYDDLTILNDFSYNFNRNDKLGIIGKNGTGKSTFLNIITGNLQCDSGVVETGETIVFGYYKQQGIKLDKDKRVIDVITDISEDITLGNGNTMTAAQFLNYFLFSYDKHYTYVSKLSGGEKRRLYLMTVLMKNPNFLILDEPTNDLDIMTLTVLEDYLQNFQGCVIVVSHDRYFMDNVVEHLFVFEGNGIIKDFPGNYSIYRDSLSNQKKKQKVEYKKNKDKTEVTEKKKTKLSYNEKREFENLEKDIRNLEEEKSNLEKEISSGTLSQAELIEKSNRLGEVLKTIDLKSNRWLELSEFI